MVAHSNLTLGAVLGSFFDPAVKNDDTTVAVAPRLIGRGAAFANGASKVHGPPDNAQPRAANLYPCPSCCDHKWEYELSMWHPKGLSGAAASAGCWNASGPGCRISDASSGSECLDASKSQVYFTACQDTSGGIPGQHFLFRNSSDNTTMAIRTADGRGCLSWRSSSAGPANSAGAQVAARPCDAADPGQQWRLATAAVPEDSAHTFLTPHGHCIHAAPYRKGNIRYQTPPVVGAWSCDDEDPAMKFAGLAANGAQQLVWRQDPARCATATASGEVTLQPCAPSVTSQLWTAKAGQIVSKADGRCLSAGCRGCKVSLASCSGGTPAARARHACHARLGGTNWHACACMLCVRSIDPHMHVCSFALEK